MRRFRPYLRYLRGRRTALVFALLFGAISGLVYGFGLPKVMNEVFPKIFTDSAGNPVEAATVSPLAPANPSRGAPDERSAVDRAAETERIKQSRTLSRQEIAGYALLIPLIF